MSSTDAEPDVATLDGDAKRVFISYSHDSDAHKERVLELADRLRTDGLHVELDQFHAEVTPLFQESLGTLVLAALAAPLLDPGLVEHTCACLEGRGSHRALLAFQRAQRDQRYVLPLDIRH